MNYQQSIDAFNDWFENRNAARLLLGVLTDRGFSEKNARHLLEIAFTAGAHAVEFPKQEVRAAEPIKWPVLGPGAK